MTSTSRLVADSVSPAGVRLTTLQLRYPKFIHGEFMTHRVLSRNASSSRAIPVERLIQDVLDDPAVPVHWGKNQSGMQAHAELDQRQRAYALGAWLRARDNAVTSARALAQIGAHKQLVNRVIEPWCHINVVVTATEWDNFYELRRHPDAQPEMRALADAMWETQQVSVPRLLEPGEWHLPYLRDEELEQFRRVAQWGDAVKLSVARCARVSYMTHDGRAPVVADDLRLYDRLVGSVPLHASPAEHQATPDVGDWFDDPTGRLPRQFIWANADEHGNLRGWRQYRKMLERSQMVGGLPQ